MNSRLCLLPALVFLLSAISACGDAPTQDTDAGRVDGGQLDGGWSDGGDAGECVDGDGDGYSAAPCGNDCDDDDATRFPGNTEVCDGDDEDCDDTTYGPDGDSDGFPSETCCNGVGNCGADCDDAAVNANPDADEICNGGIDDDCNGAADSADGVCVPCGGGFTGFDGECSDVNECMTGAPCGAAVGANCTNTTGSYVCECPAGYEAPATGGTCGDINECSVGVCGAGMATCMNTVGSYACTCMGGYAAASASGAPCVDNNECATGTPCGVSLGVCANIGGSYVCTCVGGYEAPATGGTCADVNECMRETDDCTDPPVGICTNTHPSFTCACSPGFIGTAHGASGCTPRFTDLGDGTVRDNTVGGLVWQQGISPVGLSYAAYPAYCPGLALDGGGWRLPTRDELLSIVDTSQGSPTIDTAFFPGTPAERFWSSTPVSGFPTNPWLVSFSSGTAVNSFLVGFGNYNVRCVR